MSTPPPDAPTPLAKLPRNWHGRADEILQYGSPFAGPSADIYRTCASELEAALAAAGSEHRETARELLRFIGDGLLAGAAVYDEPLIDEVAKDIARVAAAARAQGWRTCPRTGEPHRFEYDSMNPPPKTFTGSDPCLDCGIRRAALSPPRPEQGEGQ